MVILVHGYACNAAVFAWLARRLAVRGYAVYTVTLEPVFARIDDYVAPLARKVNEVAGAGGRVVLVGHSMGGLVCRAYTRRSGGARVARIVTLGTPHHGSALAPIGHGADALDMRPMGEWLRGLARSEEGGLAAPIVSIYSCHDNFVVPQASSVLAGAKNVPLAGIGHLSLLYSRARRRARRAGAARLEQGEHLLGVILRVHVVDDMGDAALFPSMTNVTRSAIPSMPRSVPPRPPPIVP